MKPSRRGFLGISAATAMTAVLAACEGGTQPGENPDGGGGGGDGDANAWILTGGMWPVINDSIGRWNEANPDQTISVEAFENDAYKERIRTAVGAGQAPTLILSWGGGTLAAYAENDQIIDISDATADLQDRLLPSVAQNAEIDGTTYAVPVNDVQPELIFYNRALFEEHGLDVPTTYAEMLQVSSAFQDAGVVPFALAGASVWPELMWIQYLTDRIGGPEAFQGVLDGEPDAWSHPAFLEATTRIQELVEAGVFGENFASVAADQNADIALVHTGRAAMVLWLSSAFATFRNDAPEFTESSLAWAPFPEIEGGEGDPANIVGNPANVFSVSAADSEAAQEAALGWISEQLYDDTQIEEMIAAGAVPPVQDIEDRLAESENGDFLTFAYELAREAPNFTLSWDQALRPGPAQELLTSLSQIFLMEITPQEFVDNMNATL
ncbi:extracellular solute-binding protein [Georgenia halophila]|uniref:Extracellular solute-binding protein n=1 Tax=Georgenia halophila TaxID=620889 RepID=A0ABP8LEP9_9MICO